MINRTVKALVEKTLKPTLKIGKIVQHPDGYLVKIIDGQFWGEYGVSNFWHWKRVLKNGKLSKKVECGYGW
jgi:hypothetical protein